MIETKLVYEYMEKNNLSNAKLCGISVITLNKALKNLQAKLNICCKIANGMGIQIKDIIKN